MPTITLNTGPNWHDAYIDKQAPSANNGTSIYLDLNSNRSIFIKPNISAIPIGAVITSATLELILNTSNSLSSPQSISVSSLIQDWSETTITESSRPNNNLGVSISLNVDGSGVNPTKQINVTEQIQAQVNGTGFGIFIASSASGGPIRFYAKENGTYTPLIYVTYNVPPTTPIITSPNGGESLNSLHTITWSPSTDTETAQVNLRYQIQLSTNNGSSWKDIVALTSIGATSQSYDFINESETSLAKIRIRAFDGISYGLWDESNGVFTIHHNVAPTIPSNLAPSGIVVDRTKTQALSWQHNDNDSQSKSDIEWRVQGASIWNAITSNGGEQSYYISPNVFPVGQIEWRVKTYDLESLASPWSNISVFTSAAPSSTPTIIQPVSPVSISRPVIEWTSVSQNSYQIVIEDSLGVVVWDTGEVVSSVKARTTGIDLVNGGNYTVKVRIKDASGIFSSYSSRTFTVSYTPPTKPIVTVSTEQSGVRFFISNPEPTGTQPTITGNEVHKLINKLWVRIAKDLSTSYTDFALVSEEVAQYRIRSIGSNGTFSESEIVEVTAPKIIGVWLHDVLDSEETIHQFKLDGDGRSDNYQNEHAFRQFAGRTRPSIQYGTFAEYNVSVELALLKRGEDRQRLDNFVRNRSTLLYRDGRGRKVYTTIPNLSADDVFYGNTVTLNLNEIDYNEEV